MQTYQTALILIAILSGISYTVFQQYPQEESILQDSQEQQTEKLTGQYYQGPIYAPSANNACARDVVQQCNYLVMMDKVGTDGLYQQSGYCAQSIRNNKKCVQKLRDVRSTSAVIMDYNRRRLWSSSKRNLTPLYRSCIEVNNLC